MDAILDRLTRAAKRCERVSNGFFSETVEAQVKRLEEVARRVGESWSGSWIGPHANIYLEGLRPRRPGEHFDAEWGVIGSEYTRGPWAEYSFDSVRDEIVHRAGMNSLPSFSEIMERARRTFEDAKAEILPAVDVVLSKGDDLVLHDKRTSLAKLKSYVSARDFVDAIRPTQFHSRDSFAMNQGIWIPPHISVMTWLMEVRSHKDQLAKLADSIRYIVNYLQMRYEMKGKSIAKTSGKVFIGHGRSLVWRDLKDFLQDRLGLEWEEFNREPTAGKSTKERLEEMLDGAVFAFLVMTAEDERADGTKHARENVVHEVGLFQGRLGFERAIVLLEEGCAEFSNITGLTQIRFPKGAIKAEFEEIRRVLEREKII